MYSILFSLEMFILLAVIPFVKPFIQQLPCLNLLSSCQISFYAYLFGTGFFAYVCGCDIWHLYQEKNKITSVLVTDLKFVHEYHTVERGQ